MPLRWLRGPAIYSLAPIDAILQWIWE